MVNCFWSLEEIGNFFLTPVRILQHGRDVSILSIPVTGILLGVHHVASFHKEWGKHVSRTNHNFHSSQSNQVLTTLSIACLTLVGHDAYALIVIHLDLMRETTTPRPGENRFI